MPTAQLNAQDRGQGQDGHISGAANTTRAAAPNPEALKRARQRARQFKEFRREYLYTQLNLARALHCSRRTIVSIENGREVMNPHYYLQRNFRDLKRKLEHQEARVA